MKVQGILETCLYVDDLQAAADFYPRVLGVQLVSAQEGRHLFYRCGNAMLLLFDPQASGQASSDVPPHGVQGVQHVAFRVPPDELPAWKQHFAEQRVTVEHEMRWPNDQISLYFRDPAGNSLELATASMWGLQT